MVDDYFWLKNYAVKIRAERLGEIQPYCFFIFNTDGQEVGKLSLINVSKRNGTFEAEIQIFQEFRRKVYGESALRLLLQYAFLELHLNKFNTGTTEKNVAYTKLLKKFGCRQEGIRREMYYSGGVYTDELLYGLTRKDFIENK